MFENVCRKVRSKLEGGGLLCPHVIASSTYYERMFFLKKLQSEVFSTYP